MIIIPADCPACYSLVQEQVHVLRHKINELREIIRNIGDNPQEVDDADFRDKMIAVNKSVDDLWKDAKTAGGELSYTILRINIWKSSVMHHNT